MFAGYYADEYYETVGVVRIWCHCKGSNKPGIHRRIATSKGQLNTMEMEMRPTCLTTHACDNSYTEGEGKGKIVRAGRKSRVTSTYKYPTLASFENDHDQGNRLAEVIRIMAGLNSQSDHSYTLEM